MAAPFRQGMMPGMFGAPIMGASTPQNNEGLGLPGGQAIFNLPRTGNVPGTTVNLPSGQVGGGAPSLKMSITRQASSDPIQNIINDISNPLSGANVDVSPVQPQKQQPAPLGMGVGAGPEHNPFMPIGVPGFEQWTQQQQQAPQFGLRSRLTRPGNMQMGPEIFL